MQTHLNFTILLNYVHKQNNRAFHTKDTIVSSLTFLAILLYCIVLLTFNYYSYFMFDVITYFLCLVKEKATNFDQELSVAVVLLTVSFPYTLV